MSKIHFVDKTRYVDLTETGSFENMVICMHICRVLRKLLKTVEN